MYPCPRLDSNVIHVPVKFWVLEKNLLWDLNGIQTHFSLSRASPNTVPSQYFSIPSPRFHSPQKHWLIPFPFIRILTATTAASFFNYFNKSHVVPLFSLFRFSQGSENVSKNNCHSLGPSNRQGSFETENLRTSERDPQMWHRHPSSSTLVFFRNWESGFNDRTCLISSTSLSMKIITKRTRSGRSPIVRLMRNPTHKNLHPTRSAFMVGRSQSNSVCIGTTGP